jgi:hypothetical protein
MADATLNLMAKEIRTKTLKLLDGLSDEQARFAAPGLHNPILWHAGHGVMLMEHLGIMPLSGSQQPQYPAGWFETFSWKSDPRQVASWPSVEEVRAQLEQQLSRLLNLLESADEATLSKLDAKGRPIRYLILHGLHDEAIHQGEMYVLRKMLAAAEKRQ